MVTDFSRKCLSFISFIKPKIYFEVSAKKKSGGKKGAGIESRVVVLCKYITIKMGFRETEIMWFSLW